MVVLLESIFFFRIYSCFIKKCGKLLRLKSVPVRYILLLTLIAVITMDSKQDVVA